MISFFHGSCSEKCTFNYLVEHKKQGIEIDYCRFLDTKHKSLVQKKAKLYRHFHLF